MKTSPEIAIKVWVAQGLPEPLTEVVFHPTRKWRFDYAWPAFKVALEVEGGVWTGGRHTRGSGFLKDVEKYNAAACLGWRIIRVTPTDLMRTSTRVLIESALGLPPF
jgi:very-short-patch-repair endonuclease